MKDHADRIRRIRALCAKIDATVEASHELQRDAEELLREVKHLTNTVSQPRPQSDRQS